jgi:DNA-directed RNA polymerase subunit alpha
MEQVTTVKIADILESETLDLADLDALRRAAFASESAWRELRAAAQKFSSGRPPASLAKRAKRAFVLLVLGRPNQAVKELEDTKATEDAAAAAILGRALLEAGEPARALEVFEAAQKKAKGSVELALGAIEARRESGDAEGALKALKALDGKAAENAEFFFQLGAAHEALGDYDAAMDAYEEAIAREPEHARALFRLAYNHELRGSADLALDYYKRCASATPTYPNALVNLGLLLEDRGAYEEAIECYHRVLRVRPNHERARMFLKDAEASLEMYYDEEQEKRSDRRNAILRTPVTDFELSVRARNCLNKMNIRNLGDLVTKTEEELLAYKNFGETSLQEIKQMLAQKGLRLGMFREAPAAAGAPAPVPEERKTGREEILKKPIGDLELSVRARNCMERLNIRTIGDLVERTEGELLAVKNFGQTSLSEIKQRLGELGLALRSERAEGAVRERGGEDEEPHGTSVSFAPREELEADAGGDNEVSDSE